MKRTTHPSERGQALVLIVAGIIALVAITALAVDGGNAFSDRRHAQNAADTSALASALAMIRGNDWYSTGLSRAADNGYDNNGATNTVQVVTPPIEGPYAGNDEYVQVIIVSHVETYFAPVIGVDEITNRVLAVARAKPPELSEMFFGNAIVSTAPHECKAMKYQGNAGTTVTGGGVFVNSDCSCDSTAAFFNNSGSAALTIPDGGLTSVGCIRYKPGAVVPAPGAPVPSLQLPYPPPYIFPDTTEMCQGATKWNGTFPPAGVTSLAAGVHCVNGTFKMNAGDTLTGHNVTIVMLNGDVSWNGGATINLDAPDSGTYKGLLIYMPLNNAGTISINGNSGSSFTGTFLAPAAAVSVNGTGGVSGMNSQIIGYTVDLSGTSATTIHYDADDNWQAPIPPQIELTQ